MRVNSFAIFVATLPLATAASAQQPGARVAVGFSSSVSSRDALLEFQLSNGSIARIELKAGHVLVDGRDIGLYRERGAFDNSFRQLLGQGSSLSAGEMLAAVKAWKPAGINSSVAQIPLAIQQLVSPIQAAPVVIVNVAPIQAVRIEPAIAPTPLPDLLPPGFAPQVGITLPVRFGAAGASAWSMIADGIASLLGAFTALAALGFGFTYFAPRQLEVVADTAIKSFGRSFFTGLFAQPLVPVVFALLMLGLILTIVGIITLPVAAVAAFALLATAGVGGYLAFARAAGELYLRRRMARGEYVGNPDTYRFLLYGVAALLSIWLPAVLFGWVPVAGPIFVWLGALATWAAATVGFGAVILSRGGVLGTFGRPAVLELTDEHLWAARTALPAARSPRSFQ